LLGFQCIPALFLAVFIKMLPDSPRYLASVGRKEEAREILLQVRHGHASQEAIDREYLEIVAIAEESKPSSPIQFAKILMGKGGRPGSNLGRRAWLCVWLQIMASWTGITAVTAYSPTLLKSAGYSQLTQNGLAGGINSIGIVGTIISAHIVDRLGRRLCLMGGAGSLAIVNLVVRNPFDGSTYLEIYNGGLMLIKLLQAGALYEGARQHPDKASRFAPVCFTHACSSIKTDI
jgi:MFS family permease